MPNVFRFRRLSDAPEPNRNSEAVYADADGTLKQVAPDGSETDLGAGGGGGSQPLTPLGPFPFAFDTPGIDSGTPVDLTTLPVGSIVLDCIVLPTVGWTDEGAGTVSFYLSNNAAGGSGPAATLADYTNVNAGGPGKEPEKNGAGGGIKQAALIPAEAATLGVQAYPGTGAFTAGAANAYVLVYTPS